MLVDDRLDLGDSRVVLRARTESARIDARWVAERVETVYRALVRIAVLIKQIPAPVEFELRDGRLVRDGVPLEVNAYCRRANAKAVELAGAEGEVVVFTMGPPAADEALREMLACGAHRGVHLCDPAFAGSDTLATAVALAAAIRREGPFDLVLSGLNSLDSDTGQVPVEVAELLGLPFAAGVRELQVAGDAFSARLETDEGLQHCRRPPAGGTVGRGAVVLTVEGAARSLRRGRRRKDRAADRRRS